jgi:membrane-bound lytic murein transglycosylase
MKLNHQELKQEIKEKQNIGYPEDDCCIEVYAYALKSDSRDPFNYNTYGTRKVMPFKGKVFLDQYEDLYVREEKNGKLLKTKINVKVKYKDSLKLFSDKESLNEEYKQDKQKILDYFDKKFEAVLNFKKELDSACENL